MESVHADNLYFAGVLILLSQILQKAEERALSCPGRGCQECKHPSVLLLLYSRQSPEKRSEDTINTVTAVHRIHFEPVDLDTEAFKFLLIHHLSLPLIHVNLLTLFIQFEFFR